MWNRLLQTSDNMTDLILWVALAVVFFPHGAQKAMGWFGGDGFTATMGFFSGKMGIPTVLVLLVITAEFLGSLGLFVGLLARVAAFGIFCTMAVAVMVRGAGPVSLDRVLSGKR